MDIKPITLILVVLALVGIITFTPSAFADTLVTMTKGSSSGQACVTANNCFSPASTQVLPGDTVTWTNADTASHTITSGNPSDNVTGTVFDSGLIRSGETFSFQFANAGTFNYYCQVHPWMIGQVIVGNGISTIQPVTPQQPHIPSGTDVIVSKGSSSGQACVTAQNCFSPSIFAADIGQSITWYNVDTASHTITSGHPSDNATGTIFDSGLVKAGGTFSFQFANAGTFNYYCQIHPWMTGQIVVGGGSVPQPVPPPQPILNATPQEIANIDEARNNQTIAAEVNVENQAVQTTSLDNNVSVETDNKSPDSLSINVSAPSETGPKVILVNIVATTINVANLKDLGVMYDGEPIPPATDIDSILYAKSTDSPSFAIVVTQSGAQILILIPHFSTHTITITNLSKVIPTVPEFGSISGIIIITSMIGVVIISRKFRFCF